MHDSIGPPPPLLAAARSCPIYPGFDVSKVKERERERDPSSCKASNGIKVEERELEKEN